MSEETTLRYECEDVVFEGAFIEFTKAWSRKEARDAWNASNEELLVILRGKVVSIYLPCIGHDSIDSPDDLILEAVETLDSRLYQWFISAWVKMMGDLTELGNALGRTLYVSQDSSLQKTMTGTKSPTNNVPPAQHRRKR